MRGVINKGDRKIPTSLYPASDHFKGDLIKEEI